MRRKDAPAMERMMAELAAFHKDKAVATAEHFIAYCLGAHRLNRAWIAFVGKAPVGFAVTYDWMNFVRGKPARTIDLLYVEKAFRGQGVGKSLVATIAQDSLKKGLLRLNVSAAKANAKANEFYKRLGFEKGVNRSHKYALEAPALSRLAKAKTLLPPKLG